MDTIVVTDASGKGNDGTPKGDLKLNDNGKVGKCFEFNGTNTLDTRYYTGLMDEVKIFDSALTEADIQANLLPIAVDASGKLSSTWGLLKKEY